MLNKFKAILIFIGVSVSISFVATQCNMKEKDILKYYLEIKQKLKLTSDKQWKDIEKELNRRVKQDPEVFAKKISVDVDQALVDYQEKERKIFPPSMKNQTILKEILKPKYSNMQRLIIENAIYYELPDGSMGIRGAWTKPWPNEIDLGKNYIKSSSNTTMNW